MAKGAGLPTLQVSSAHGQEMGSGYCECNRGGAELPVLLTWLRVVGSKTAHVVSAVLGSMCSAQPREGGPKLTAPCEWQEGALGSLHSGGKLGEVPSHPVCISWANGQTACTPWLHRSWTVLLLPVPSGPFLYLIQFK